MNQKSILIGVGILLFANLGVSIYSIKANNDLKSEIQVKYDNLDKTINEKVFKLSESDITLIAAKSSIFNQSLKKEMEDELKLNRQAFQIYSEAYINELTKNTKNVMETLYPENSKSAIAKQRFDALMAETELDNHDYAVKTGLIEGKTSDQIIKEQEYSEMNIEETKQNILLRMKNLFPEKTEQELLDVLNAQPKN